jgi:hypothetical protein
MLDGDLDKKLRKIQSEQILKLEKSVSFSAVLNSVLRSKLK